MRGLETSNDDFPVARHQMCNQSTPRQTSCFDPDRSVSSWHQLARIAAIICETRNRSSSDLGRVVKETLARNPVAAPLLPCDLVETADQAGFLRQFEIPVD